MSDKKIYKALISSEVNEHPQFYSLSNFHYITKLHLNYGKKFFISILNTGSKNAHSAIEKTTQKWKSFVFLSLSKHNEKKEII